MRLQSTRSIFNNRIQTTYNLLVKTDAQITRDYHNLNILRGRILRSTRPKTLEKIKVELEVMARDMGHTPPSVAGKDYLLGKINQYKRQNSYLLYAAIHQAIINTCVIYEDFVKRIILKYFEENIRRLSSKKDAPKNKDLIDAILRGDNIHRTLAEKATNDLMYGSVETWHDILKGQGMNLMNSLHVNELFLIRNCLVHNNSRVSSQLHAFMPSKYLLRKPIHTTVVDVETFKDEVHKTAIFIISEYSRLHPKNLGTWL